ncbi:Uncharacterized protein FKW44_003950 [Caligus rogercresseyi]|uniref:MULE transposase domain-containing protein n=1 Tax=Caligus rogercresseyi TaxID=217165 RepID=A0A7T8QXE6_CALRO|nr:Uncharacterized protein FKW44_003950 [Caligus rogercresseyi]
MPLQFVNSSRGNKKLFENGHSYIREREVGQKTIWKCDQYFSLFCRARVHTNTDTIVKVVGQHNHAGNIAKVEAIRAINLAKEIAISTQESTHSIATNVFVGASISSVGHLPNFNQLKRTIRNKRKSQNQAPPQPFSLSELLIPMEYHLTYSQEPFLLFDSNDRGDRILIFSTQDNLTILSQANTWYADGTFKVAPPLFEQLYTLHGVILDNVVPLVFVLMASKSEQCYKKLFLKLKELNNSLNPSTIMTDFEKASINAFTTSFPTTEQKGCFFHFCQCIFRSIQSSGLKRQYENDIDFALKMRMLAALAFVPPEDVVQSFEVLVANNNYLEESQIVLDYVEDNWIGRPNCHGIRRPPRFNINLWNCYEAAKECGSKTNNSCEAWHRSFNELVGSCHPTIWKFIDTLKKEQAKNEIIINQYLSGEEPPRQKKKYKNTALRLQRVTNNYHECEIMDYLRGIAYNLSF